MKNDISLEEKKEILKKNGWNTVWNENEWVHKSWYTKGFRNDLGGTSTEKAYEIYLKELNLDINKNYSILPISL